MKDRFFAALAFVYVAFGLLVIAWPPLLVGQAGALSFALGVVLLIAAVYFMAIAVSTERHTHAMPAILVCTSGGLFGLIAIGAVGVPADTAKWESLAIALWASVVLLAAAAACYRIHQRVRNGLTAFD